ncbi:MAG: chemotaxis protein CheW [Burkholderiales bacterium]|nr:chemotaxis protein CheW [Anaerolineae bacterium]
MQAPARALPLARRYSDTTPVLTFRLAQQCYALLIEDVVEVAAMVKLVTIVDAPTEVLGVANRHGAIVPVIDLRRVMRSLREKQPAANVVDATMPTVKDTTPELFIVVNHSSGRRIGRQLAGLVVDEVMQVEYIDFTGQQVAPGSGRFVQGIITHHAGDSDELVQVLALPPLLAAFLPDGDAMPLEGEWVENGNSDDADDGL